MDCTLEQFNAFSFGAQLKKLDDMASLLQGAYYTAYWSGGSKHKKSLKSVLRSLYAHVEKKKREPIDFEKVDKEFKRLEDLKKHGWYQE